MESLGDWFQVLLETSERLESAEAWAMFVDVNSLDTLQSHQVLGDQSIDRDRLRLRFEKD